MELVIHFRKKRLYLDIYQIVLISLILGAISYVFTYIKVYIAPVVFLAVLLTAWPWLLRIFQVLFFRQPALIINDAGIRLFPVHIPGNFFISWSEIQKISIEQYGSEKCICIYPKDEKKYLSHFSLLKRFVTRLWNLKGQFFMNISLLHLDKSPAEIFQQIAYEYADELHDHNIQLQP